MFKNNLEKKPVKDIQIMTRRYPVVGVWSFLISLFAMTLDVFFITLHQEGSKNSLNI